MWVVFRDGLVLHDRELSDSVDVTVSVGALVRDPEAVWDLVCGAVVDPELVPDAVAVRRGDSERVAEGVAVQLGLAESVNVRDHEVPVKPDKVGEAVELRLWVGL